jgi:hypothetical protein
MRANPLLNLVLDDDVLTRGLGDAEARVLIEWLVEQIEQFAEQGPPERAESAARRLCRRGRAIAHFVRLWCLDRAWGSALQLAASERFVWPMPETQLEACELMQEIVFWEMHSNGAPQWRAA